MPIQLLLVEDNPADTFFLQSTLKARNAGEYAVTVAETLEGAGAMLAQREFEAALLDLSLPDSHGLETIERLAAMAPKLPIVVLSGVADASIVPEAVRRGAQDYLLKGRCDGEAIARAIRYAIDRKRIEEELRQARNELETRVQQRTEQLARSHADLLKAKEAAEAASRAKSAFLANMSHEMRTPLNAIIGMTELVLHDQVPPRQREYLSTVEGSAETLLALIENLLDLSSIDAGKVTLATATFDLWRNLGEAMAPLAQRAQRQGLQLDWRIAPRVPRLASGDWDRLRQVVANLLDNALKFTERGEVGLEVDLESLSDVEMVLHCIVRDTGVGIPEDKQATIFGMEQADSSLTRRYGGIGLGLALASRLVGLMDGRMWVESEVGRGSRFHFTARLGREPAIAVPASGPAAPAQPSFVRKLRVLLAEASAMNQKVVLGVLEKEGHTVTVAGNRAKFFAALDAQQFDLVLLDTRMPGLDRREATARIRDKQQQAGARIPVIALVADNMEGDHEQCLGIAVDACINKPVQAKALLDAIKAVCACAASEKD